MCTRWQAYVSTHTHTHTLAHAPRPTRLGCSPTSTLVLWTGSQGVPKEACFALVAVDTCCIVDALETSACQAVTVPGGTGVHIVVALTGLTGPHWATFPEGVPEVAISTELAAGTWKKQMATPSGLLPAARAEAQAERTLASGAGSRGKGRVLFPPAGRGFRSQQPRSEPPCQSTRWSGKSQVGGNMPRAAAENGLSFQTDRQGGVTFKGLYVFPLYLGSSVKTELNHVFCLRTSSPNY